MDFVQKIVHSIRSARSDYNLAKGTKTEGTFQPHLIAIRVVIIGGRIKGQVSAII